MGGGLGLGGGAFWGGLEGEGGIWGFVGVVVDDGDLLWRKGREGREMDHGRPFGWSLMPIWERFEGVPA